MLELVVHISVPVLEGARLREMLEHGAGKEGVALGLAMNRLRERSRFGAEGRLPGPSPR